MSGAPAWLAVAVTAGGALMALAPLMQLWRIVRMRSAADVSVALFAIVTVGTGLWVAYGIYEADVPLIAANALAVCTNLLVVLVALRYRRFARQVRVVAHVAATDDDIA